LLNEKPSPTVNKAVRKKENSHCAAGTNIKEPNAESNKPADNVFLYPNFCKTSTLMIPRRK
jgi:hypothetical protein